MNNLMQNSDPQQSLVKQHRAAGVLLPVSSLPSKYGIGTLGRAAKQWVDFLKKAGQTYWQILPLNPTGFGNSPYQSVSTFAGNPYLIDLDLLCEQGLLTAEECSTVQWADTRDYIDYDKLFQHRDPLLRKAYARFFDKTVMHDFKVQNAEWIEEYALYISIKSQQNLKPWTAWEDCLRLREPQTLSDTSKMLSDEIEYHVFVQYIFDLQWNALKKYANQCGISIIGDIPIYVALDSADTWAHSEIFYLDEQKMPVEVAGCPPDGFCETGQLWGNPLYRWDVMAADGYSWWRRRLLAGFKWYDKIRIDHFRGLESYYSVPAGHSTATQGQWRQGPGYDFIKLIKELSGPGKIIFEDLGYLTPEVHALRETSGYPGMKVLQFAFDPNMNSEYLPYNYGTNYVVYTGTHDNDTVLGWAQTANTAEVNFAMEYFGLKDLSEINWAFIRAALGSVANDAIIPMQDYLNLASEGRINTPSILGDKNWAWRMRIESIDHSLALKIARMTSCYGRNRK